MQLTAPVYCTSCTGCGVWKLRTFSQLHFLPIGEEATASWLLLFAIVITVSAMIGPWYSFFSCLNAQSRERLPRKEKVDFAWAGIIVLWLGCSQSISKCKQDIQVQAPHCTCAFGVNPICLFCHCDTEARKNNQYHYTEYCQSVGSAEYPTLIRFLKGWTPSMPSFM